MVFKAFLIKYAEIGVKGKNRGIFEDIWDVWYGVGVRPQNGPGPGGRGRPGG